MSRILKQTGMVLFYAALIILSGELVMRVMAAVKPIYSVEMMKYASSHIIKSPSPNIAHVHRPNASGRLMGVDLTLNSMGHRSRELQHPKLPSEKRIFVLGSSITMGWGVKPEDVFTADVENRLNRDWKDSGIAYTVVNAGIANYNTVYEVELFKGQVDQVEPDMVVLNYFINDAKADPIARQTSILKHSFFLAFIYERLAGLYAGIKGKSLVDDYRELYKDGQTSWERCKQAVLELKAMCADRKIPLVILFMPDTHNLSQEGPYPAIYDKAVSTFRQMNIETLNTYPEFYEKYGKDPKQLWVAIGDPHPNRNGHLILADNLYEYLVRHPI